MKKHRFILTLATALFTVLFFIGGPDYYSSRSFKHFWNLGHILYFSLLPILLFPMSSFKKQKPDVQIAIVIIATIVTGILIELVQSTLSRTPDMGDIFRNLIGAGIAICFLLPAREKLPTGKMIIYKTILIIFAGSQIYPIAIALIDEHHARAQFPILSNFQTDRQLHRWEGDATISIENDIGRAGNHALRADLGTQRYSGVALKYFPRNWQGYRYFEYRIFNPNETPIKITCRIHDKLHVQGQQLYADRFNRTESIPSGWHTVTIALDDVRMSPATREMDLSQIYTVSFFATQLPHPKTIYINEVRLY